MCKLKKEQIKRLKAQKEKDLTELKSLQLQQADAWKETDRFLELLREKRILEGRIFNTNTKIRNLERGKKLLAK